MAAQGCHDQVVGQGVKGSQVIKNIIRTLAGVLCVIMVGVLGYSMSITASADDRAAGQGPQIIRVENNVHGTDTAANAYLESVAVQNLSDAPVNLTGWYLRDTTGHRFTFPEGYTLGANATVRVRTGVMPATASAWWANPAFNLYWKLSHHQYGNRTDSVSLRDATGVEHDYVSWSDFTIFP